MTEWLTVNSSDPNLLTVAISDMYGGKNIYLCLGPQLVDTIQQHKAQLAHEQQMRANNPDLQELYLSYQTALNLISK